MSDVDADVSKKTGLRKLYTRKQTRNQLLNYGKYRLSFGEWGWLFARTGGLLFAIGYLFYDSLLVFLLFLPMLGGMYIREKKLKISKRRQRLAEQFKDAIILLYSFVSTGSTLEQAFCKSSRELLLSFSPDADIVREFDGIQRKLDMNVTIEACMEDFAKRSRIEDIDNFSQVIAIAKRSGGSMSSIIKNSVDTIKTEIESENEIRTLISARSNEFRLMTVIPAGVLLYMRLFSSGFMDVLYTSLSGAVFMTVCLGIYIFAMLWGFRILDIRI